LLKYDGDINLEEKIKVGQIVNAVGLKGEVKVYNYSDYKERFEELEEIYLEEQSFKIEKVRYKNHMVILKLLGIDDRNAAEAQKGKALFITETDLRVLPADTHYVRDLIGLAVETEDGHVGTLTDVLQRSAQDLYEVELENKKKILIPVVEAFVLDIDIEKKRIIVKLIEGMLELQN